MTRCGLILLPLLLTYCMILAVIADDETDAAEEEDDEDSESEVTDEHTDQAGPITSDNKAKKKDQTESSTSNQEQGSAAKTGTTRKPTITTAKPAITTPTIITTTAKPKTTTDEVQPQFATGKTGFPTPDATVLHGESVAKTPKKSPWEKMPNAPTFVGHLVVPYPSSNFISLTMKQAYVLYLWLQVRRLNDLFKDQSKGEKPDGELDLNDINAMISDFSKTGFMKLPLPYKPPLFLPTDSENLEGTGDERKRPFIFPPSFPERRPPVDTEPVTEIPEPTTLAPTLPPTTFPPPPEPTEQPEPIDEPEVPEPLRSPFLFPPPVKPRPLEATGSQNFPPPTSISFPSFPAFRSQVYAKKNPKEWPSNLPMKLLPGYVSFPSKIPPRPKAVYPSPNQAQPMSAMQPKPSAQKAFSRAFAKIPIPKEPKRPPPPPVQPKRPQPKPLPVPSPTPQPPPPPPPSQPEKDRRRFFQRVANYMNQLGHKFPLRQ